MERATSRCGVGNELPVEPLHFARLMSFNRFVDNVRLQTIALSPVYSDTTQLNSTSS